MNIVVLDGFTLNPGDLSWAELEKLGNLKVYDRTEANLTIERSKDAEIVITNKTVITDSLISQLPNLKYVGVLSTGYNVVDTLAAAKKGIVVTNVPAYSTDSVAQITFSLLLELVINVGVHDKSVHKGEWANSADFSYSKTPLIELQGLTFGIIGFGRIGRAVAKIANAFGMNVLANNRSEIKEIPDYVTVADKPEIFNNCDVVSLHVPLTNENSEFVNAKILSMMKSSAYIINTGRGGLINEQDLADALNNGKIAGAGLDVLSTEPPLKDNPLLSAKNCVITPHIAWATIAARKRLMKIAVDNVRAFLNGNQLNIVN
ncbi:MAG: D-2-hydroxyacid dehydrogenase [Bacteroidetes bacterium]|nr:D-2-hydroxyacid dehydrogenase [Bacteroidota bacterium]MBU1115556.1 D-2-hydroxyacid dehydrogenase [Bacteroidota bacterium]MBU1797712.1 D-2-hydroxyacid dehydrogenase [Bacteroidota bacterium]